MGIIVDVPAAGLDYVLYGNKSGMIGNYLYQQMQGLPDQFNEFGQRVYNNLRQAYDFVTDKLTQYGIMNQLRQNNVRVEKEFLMELNTFDQFRQANMTMQRWVMANPVVREQYLKNNIDGYSNTYENIFGDAVGQNHYDYRRVMNGVVIDDDPEYEWKMYEYHDQLQIGDRELDHYEKTLILNTWNASNELMKMCKFDFTSASDELVKRNIED